MQDKTANKPTESNLCLPNDTSHVSGKNNNATTVTEISRENHPGKRKIRNPETTQKVTNAELLYQLKKWMHNLKKGREKVRIVKMPSTVKTSANNESTSLEEEKTSKKKKKRSSLPFDLEFDE